MSNRIAVIAKQTQLYSLVGRIPDFNVIYTSDNKDNAILSIDD